MSRGFHVPLRSACRVWLPSGRLTPSEPAPALFRAGSALGIAPFEAFPSRKVSEALPPGMNPRAVSLAGIHAACATSRSSEPRLPGFDPFESPLRPSVCLAHRPPAAPLGFVPSRAFLREPWRASARSPLTRFSRTTPGGGRSSGVPEYQSARASPRPRPAGQAAGSGRSNPQRVSAPVRSCTFRG